jgi:hypothetical protein
LILAASDLGEILRERVVVTGNKGDDKGGSVGSVALALDLAELFDDSSSGSEGFVRN